MNEHDASAPLRDSLRSQNSLPAYSPPAYSPPAYSPPAYSPPAYSPPNMLQNTTVHGYPPGQEAITYANAHGLYVPSQHPNSGYNALVPPPQPIYQGSTDILPSVHTVPAGVITQRSVWAFNSVNYQKRQFPAFLALQAEVGPEEKLRWKADNLAVPIWIDNRIAAKAAQENQSRQDQDRIRGGKEKKDNCCLYSCAWCIGKLW